MVFKELVCCICSSIFGTFGGLRRVKVSSFFDAVNVTREESDSCTSDHDSDELIDKASRLEDDTDEEGVDAWYASDEGEMEKICCVCLSRMANKGDDRRSLPCSHEFHGECIDSWLKNTRRKTCPLCRLLVEEGEEESIKSEFLTDEMMVWFSSFHVAGF